MAGFRLITSNRLEVLADKLSESLTAPLASPLTTEVIVVQSRGMARWLAMEIARRRGICANVRFPFPKSFVEEAFHAASGDAGTAAMTVFTPETMTWKIMQLLPAFLEKPGFEQIKHYLREERVSPAASPAAVDTARPFASESSLAGAGLRRYQLAERLADLFDQYLVFRPEMMAAWEEGKTLHDDERWQCSLWQALIAGTEISHPAIRKKIFLRGLHLVPDVSYRLPERFAVFGISALPRFYLEVFHALSQVIEVNMFLMNPSREFWSDIRSDRERDRVVERVREAGGDFFTSESLYLERGNRLLASLGTLGREFYSLVWEFPGEEDVFFQEPETDDLLASVQGDILNLHDRGAEDRKVTALADRSIQFHSCHSPLREIEVLYDNLLALFEADKELLPRDILVMAPDIGVYADLIKAVFDRPSGLTAADGPVRIPFTVADRAKGLENSLFEAFVRVLDMTGSRCRVTEVLALLELPEVSARFDITPADAELIRRWVTEAGIRWGIDSANRSRLGLPPRRENTWREGLERLLMGYAMPGKDGCLVEGILPYDDMEGSETVVLGKLLDYTETLFPLVIALTSPRTLSEWGRFLEEMFDRVFAPQDDNVQAFSALREAILRLAELENGSGFRERVDLKVIKACLRRTFAEEGFGYGFLAGGVTFCSLLPMRSIPASVICLLGMNGADYPRRSRVPAFDLMARHPEPGDRSRRKDDRYLFLEALLSARRKLIISYVGQDSGDNATLPPSVLVAELLAYLEGVCLAGRGILEGTSGYFASPAGLQHGLFPGTARPF